MSRAAMQRRRDWANALVPVTSYPEALPVSQRRSEIARHIRDNQVVIVAGETGSGKTTQLPKICLDLGRGVRGTIGHTQPRRIAARSVAERIADELGVELGGAVGYRVRFGDRAGPDNVVRVMTDGVLLAETRRDPLLRRYDTVIVDEAHERSLTIDFLLGYLTNLLPRRPDLKVIITSATIDPGRFSAHFGGAPVVEVSGRTYPVEVRYRPYGAEAELPDDRDQAQAIVDAVAELATEPSTDAGDVLVFLSGEREIRDTADALRRDWPTGSGTEIVPLYARLSAVEQHRVFESHPGRRIVLATNVAETSLTVPGIRYVVDPGTARISRYSRRTKVLHLPIEPVSQASARQRAGRCGRLADGICIRLYTAEDYEARPAFTEPEILRTNLASVLLQMAALELGDVTDFPFVDPPDRRSVRDGLALLSELGALTDGTITDLGRRLAQFPVDPRIGRMILAAADNGCVAEVLVIAAGLTIVDPRERPSEPASAKEAATQAHSRFAHPTSDFLAYLNLWRYLDEQQRELSSSAFRRLCRAEYLHYLRVREWQDLHGQLRSVAAEVGVRSDRLAEPPTDPAAAAARENAIHQSLLAGLLTQIGMWDPVARTYLGTRGVRFAPVPGSAAVRKRPHWIMAAELVETSRLWARTTAAIQPEWVEPLAGELLQRTYSEPRWDRRRAAVVATEKVVLLGLPLVTARTVAYGRIDPAVARELFIRHALVEGDWDMRPPARSFVRDNLALRDELRELEERTRTRGLIADDDELFALYDARVPPGIVSARHFDTWWRRESRADASVLRFTREQLLVGRPAEDGGAFPDSWSSRSGHELALTYRFDPGAPDDGVTVAVPLALLPEITAEELEWQVPGMREDVVDALIRSLPKSLRRSFVPAREYAAAICERLADRPSTPVSLRAAVADELSGFGGTRVAAGDFDPGRVPDHLRMAVAVVDDRGRIVATGRDLAALQDAYAHRARAARAAVTPGIERSGLRSWTIGMLPRTVQSGSAGHALTGYPALVDEGATVGVRVFASAQEQSAAMARGTTRLILLDLGPVGSDAVTALGRATLLGLASGPHGSVAAATDDVRAAIVDHVVARLGGPAWDDAAYARLLSASEAGIRGGLRDSLLAVAEALRARDEVATAARGLAGRGQWRESVSDVQDQMDALVRPGFVADLGLRRLQDLVRWLRAARHRLLRLAEPHRDPARMLSRDLVAMERVHGLEASYAEVVAELPPGRRGAESVRDVRWMLQELRVSLFAQELGTAYPISDKRVANALAELRSNTDA